MTNKKILAIDFGDKNIGLAATDPGRQLVFGKGTLKMKKSLHDLFEEIGDFCEREKVVKIVFGLPKGKNDEDTDQSQRLEKIGDKLKVFLEKSIKDLVFEFEDESFTSYEAREMAAGFDDKALKSKYSEHELAAMIILKRYLKHHPEESE